MYNYNNRNTKKFLICFCLSILVMGTFSFATINKTSIFSKNKSQEASIFTPKKDDPN